MIPGQHSYPGLGPFSWGGNKDVKRCKRCGWAILGCLCSFRRTR